MNPRYLQLDTGVSDFVKDPYSPGVEHAPYREYPTFPNFEEYERYMRIQLETAMINYDNAPSLGLSELGIAITDCPVLLSKLTDTLYTRGGNLYQGIVRGGPPWRDECQVWNRYNGIYSTYRRSYDHLYVDVRDPGFTGEAAEKHPVLHLGAYPVPVHPLIFSDLLAVNPQLIQLVMYFPDYTNSAKQGRNRKALTKPFALYDYYTRVLGAMHNLEYALYKCMHVDRPSYERFFIDNNLDYGRFGCYNRLMSLRQNAHNTYIETAKSIVPQDINSARGKQSYGSGLSAYECFVYHISEDLRNVLAFFGLLLTHPYPDSHRKLYEFKQNAYSTVEHALVVAKMLYELLFKGTEADFIIRNTSNELSDYDIASIISLLINPRGYSCDRVWDTTQNLTINTVYVDVPNCGQIRNHSLRNIIEAVSNVYQALPHTYNITYEDTVFLTKLILVLANSNLVSSGGWFRRNYHDERGLLAYGTMLEQFVDPMTKPLNYWYRNFDTSMCQTVESST